MISGHGDDLYRYPEVWANFSSNVYAEAQCTGLLEHLHRRMDAVLGSYPEPEPYTLQRELAAALSIGESEVMVTNGATEAIYLVALLLRMGRTHIVEPTFSEYRDACTLMQHHIEDRIESYVGLDSVWLCNPNNPTGRLYAEVELDVDSHPDTLFVIDRSYEYFSRKPLPEELRRDNVLYIHSLTKRYRIPGLRLGYLTGTAKTLERIRVLRQPWSVNALAIEAGRWIVRNGLPETIDRVSLWQEADSLRKSLNAIAGVRVEPTDTHFMLVELPTQAAVVKEYLARMHGLLVRDASNFRGLSERHIRIATQTPEANRALVEALTAYLNLGE